MKSLIIELQYRGHILEYVNHLLNGYNKGDEKINCIFFLSPHIKPLVPLDLKRELRENIYYFSYETISDYENCKSNKERSDFYWNLIFKIKKEYIFDHVFFLNLNISFRNKYILNPLRNPGFTFSGIFFQSPYRLRKQGLSKLKQRISRELILKLLIINKNCLKIHLLNDKEGFIFYSNWSSKVHYLPDPVNKVEPSCLSIYEFHRLPKDSFIFLHIGALGPYKGSIEILEAVKKLPIAFFFNVKILFVGYMNNTLVQAIKEVNGRFGEEVIVTRNEFVGDKDFAMYIEQSQCILIANKNVESSSGILNHSLARKKNLIAPNYGYYKDQLYKYKGSLLFDEIFPLEMTLLKMKNNFKEIKYSNDFDALQFCRENSPEKFFEVLTLN